MVEYRIANGEVWRQPSDLEVARQARHLKVATRLGGDLAVYALLAAVSVARAKRPGETRGVAEIFASFSVDHRSISCRTVH
jgi:hypothetical protein